MENEFVEKAGDVNVTGRLLYTKASPDGHVYIDSECTIPATAAQLKHFFEMDQAVIVSGTNKIRPIYLTTYADRVYVSLSYVVSGPVIETVYSSEYALTEADIKSFVIDTGTAVINAEAKTIAVSMPRGSVVTALTPTFTISNYASIKVGTTDQVSGVTANDFTNPVTYTVTAEDGVTVNEWVVTVTVFTETEADIKTFAIATGAEAVIDSTDKTIAITMPLGTTVTALTPTFTISDYATIKVGATEQVSGETANDFTNPVTYTVTAEDGVTVNEWVVTVTVATE